MTSQIAWGSLEWPEWASIPTSSGPTPTPVGGLPTQADIVPCVVLALAYLASLFPRHILRLPKDISPAVTRATNSMGTFCLFRLWVVYHRTTEAIVYPSDSRTDWSTTSITQFAWAYGFLELLGRASLLVSDWQTVASLKAPDSGPKTKEYRLFYTITLISAGLSLLPFGVSVMGAICFRYVSTITGLLFGLRLLYRLYAEDDTGPTRSPFRREALWAVVLILVIPTYRLTVMFNDINTDIELNYQVEQPGSLSSTSSKVLFYALHAAPELLASHLLRVLHVRKAIKEGDPTAEHEPLMNELDGPNRP